MRMKKPVEIRLLLVLKTKEKRVKWSCFQNKLLLLRECKVRHHNFLQLFIPKIENNSKYKLSFLFSKTILKNHFRKNVEKKVDKRMKPFEKKRNKREGFMILIMNTIRVD